MIKQNINIVGVPILYNILEEIKENLSFKIVNYIKLEDFKKFLNENKVLNNILVVTKFENRYSYPYSAKGMAEFERKIRLRRLDKPGSP